MDKPKTLAMEKKNKKPMGDAKKETLDKAAPSVVPPAPPQPTSVPLEAAAAYIPAPKFQGSKAGYLLKVGSSGLGYYKDELGSVRKSTIPSSSRPQPSSAEITKQVNRSNAPIIARGKKRKDWDEDDSEDNFAPLNNKLPGGKKKSLPGRMRKKLRAV